MGTFASRTTKTIPIPFDPPHEVLIQKLAGRHLQRAQQAFFNELVAGIRERGGAAVQKDLQQLFKGDEAATKEKVAEQQKDPLNGFDAYVICQKGIKAWTFVDEAGQSIPVTPETIEDLDEEAVRFFATEIMRLTKPGLFQSEEEAKATQKETHAAPSVS